MQFASLAEAFSAAAERLDDLTATQRYLQAANELRPPERRDAFTRKLEALAAERDRRTKNAARQPVIRNLIEQDRVVRPEIARSAR